MYKKRFVIYDKTTGLTDGGTGIVDLDDAGDPSCLANRIPEIAARKSSRAVVYLPPNIRFDPARHKIMDGRATDIPPDERPQPVDWRAAYDRCIDDAGRIRVLARRLGLEAR